MSQKHLARIINRSESYVSERVAILNYPEELRDALYQGKISFSVCRELYKIPDTEDMLVYTRFAVQNGCTPEIARNWRKQLEAQKRQTTEEITERAVENYEQATNKTTVMMLCKICNENTDVNELVTMYVCKSCVDVLRKATAI